MLQILVLAASVASAAHVETPFTRAVLNFRPESGTNLGLSQYNGKLSLPTPQNIAAQIAFFESVPSLPGIDQAAMAAIARSQLHELRDRKSYLTDVAAAQNPYELLQAQIAQAGSGDWEAIVARTEQIPAYVEAVRDNLRQGAQEGRKAFKGLVEKDGLETGSDAAAFFETELHAKAKAQLDAASFAALEPRLKAAGAAAAAAYRAHVSFLKAEILPVAETHYGIGPGEYAWKLKHELGIDSNPFALRRQGLELAEKITAKMEALAKQIDPTKTLPQLMAELKTDHPKDDAELLSTYVSVSDRARDFVVANRLFAIPADYKINVIETPPGMRSAIGSAAYFPAPPLDASKKGVFLVTPSGGDPKRLAIHNFSKIPTTVVHEAFPGHDMQFWSFQRTPSISTERYLTELAGWGQALNVEGYAHYAEELMRARGFFTPKEELTQLGAQLWRAYRIALDTALHAGQITMEEVAKTLTEKAFLPESIAKVEAYRYIKWPTQAITYLLGRLAIEDIKSEYRKVMGSDYAEAEFHKLFLSYGPVLPSVIKPDLLKQARQEKRALDLKRTSVSVSADIRAAIAETLRAALTGVPQGFEIVLESRRNGGENPMVQLRRPDGVTELFFLHEAAEKVWQLKFSWRKPSTWLPKTPATLFDHARAVIEYANLIK